jgi:hemolysin activation/secretion protein
MEGTSYALNLGISHDILRSRNENLIANIGFDYANGENDILSTQFYDDRTRILSAGVDWNNSDSLGGSNTANIGIRQGLDILNASRKGSLLLSRAEGESDFTAFTADASREQQLGRGFLGIISTSGQYAPQPLLSGQEFGYGGQQFGRGYDSSELTGDSGIAASLELRYYDVPSPVDNLNLVPYSFFDIGKVWNRDTGGENVSGASTGLGLMAGYEDLYGNFSIALPLRHEAATPPSYANGNSPRFLFSLQKSF